MILFSTNMTMPHEALKSCFLEKCLCSSHTLQVLASARLCLYRITLALHCGKNRVDRTINLRTLGIVSLFPHGWLKECYFWIMMWGWNVTFKEHTQSDLYFLWTIIFRKYQKYLTFFFQLFFPVMMRCIGLWCSFIWVCSLYFRNSRKHGGVSDWLAVAQLYVPGWLDLWSVRIMGIYCAAGR